jgi:hypothetical protein
LPRAISKLIVREGWCCCCWMGTLGMNPYLPQMDNLAVLIAEDWGSMTSLMKCLTTAAVGVGQWVALSCTFTKPPSLN